MALTLATVLRDDLANQIDDSINAGSTDANGDLKFETSGDVEVATIQFQDPAFGAASTGVITMAGAPLSDTNATGGTVAQFSIYDRDNVKQLEGVVLTSGGDINLTSLAIVATDTVELTSLAIDAPA